MAEGRGIAGGGGPGDILPTPTELLLGLQAQMAESRQVQIESRQAQAQLGQQLAETQVAFATQIQQLQNTVNALQIRANPLPPAPEDMVVPPVGPIDPEGPGPINPPNPGHAPAALTPMPKRYSGDPLGFQQFMLQCELHFTARPVLYANSVQQVNFILMLLDGNAFQWAAPLIESQSILLQNYQLFKQAFAGVFRQQYHAVSRRQELMEIEQGERSVIDYVAHFSTLAAGANCSEEMKISIFHRGLKGEIQDTIMMVDPLPATLDAFIGLTLRMEHQLKNRKIRRGKKLSPVPIFQQVTPVMPDPVEPMVLGAGRNLSAKERTRRRDNNLCLYCGKDGHLVAQCPVKPRKTKELGVISKGANSNRVVSQVSGPVVKKQTAHLLLKGTLLAKKAGIQIPVTALLDCGAPGSYIDQALFQRLGLKAERKEVVQPLTSVDGRMLKGGPVAQRSPSLIWQMDGFSPEAMHLDIIYSPRFQVILGMDWLRRNNPMIDWVKGEVTKAPEGVRQRVCGAAERDTSLGESTIPLLDQGLGEFLVPERVNQEVHDPLTVKGETLGAVVEGVPEVYKGWADVFDKKEAEALPPHRDLDCVVTLEPNRPIPHGRIYALSVKEDKILHEYIKDNVTKGFIRPSSSPAGAPIFFVPKKDCADLRPCCDYRRLNNITVPYRYPLPLISVLFDQLRGASVFTKLDLRGAYNLLRMKEGEEWKTAFNSRYGHYEFLVMPFGLCNAPAFFQRFIHSVFEDILHQYVIVYLDDILVYSKSLEEHVGHVKEVLQRLRAHRLYAKGTKCMFSESTVPFLGYLVSEQGFVMDPAKVAAIQDWPPPENLKGIQRLLGFMNYYRKFIPNYATETLAITALLSPKTTFVWGPEQSAAFDSVKRLFLEGAVLQHPDLEKQFFVETDASSWATGAILSQKSNKGFLLPVAFQSHKLTATERNYSTFDAELFAIKLALKEWRHYLEGALHPVIIITDHRNLEALRKTSVMSPRQSRWTLFFSRFDVRITFRPGARNVRADALSRMYPQPEDEEQSLSGHVFPPECVLAAIGDPLTSFLEDVKGSYVPEERERFLFEDRTSTEVDGLLFHNGRLWVPTGGLQEEVLSWVHSAPLSGHPGIRRTIDLMSRHVWWPGMRASVEEFVKLCPVCVRAKAPRGAPAGPLHPLPIPELPWSLVTMDFVTDLPPSGGFRHIWCVKDALTKSVHLVPLRTIPSAPALARLFVTHIVRLHGLPQFVISDRGPQFTARFWRAVLTRLGIDQRLSTAYHPQTDGATERSNQDLEQYLRCYCLHDSKLWATYLPMAEFALNNGVQSAIKMSPFKALYGYNPLPWPTRLVGIPGEPLADAFLKSYRARVVWLQANLVQSRATMKAQADKHRSPVPNYEVGDMVWLSTANIKMPGSPKFKPRHIGPFSVLQKISEVAMKLDLPQDLRIHPVFHVSLLKPGSNRPTRQRAQVLGAGHVGRGVLWRGNSVTVPFTSLACRGRCRPLLPRRVALWGAYRPERHLRARGNPSGGPP